MDVVVHRDNVYLVDYVFVTLLSFVFVCLFTRSKDGMLCSLF